MLTIKVHASGSTGNLYQVADQTTTLMIEAGIRFRLIREAFNFELSRVSACLISHEHGDHAKAVKDIMKAGIDCYLSPGTANALKVSGHRVKVAKPKQVFRVGSFQILPFETQHYAAEPLGYLIQSDCGDKLLFITDSYYCRYKFTGVTHYMVECNYSLKILEESIKAGITPPEIRNRIVKSHFELSRVIEFFQVNNHPGIKEIHLIHLSGGNSDPDHFKGEIQKVTGKPVYVHARGVDRRQSHGGGTSLNKAANGRGIVLAGDAPASQTHNHHRNGAGT